MTTALNELQIASTAQEKNKVFFDHEPLSALRQRSALCSSIADGGSQSTSQQHALRPCIYIAFRCSHCGPVRQAIAELPTQAVIACPECSRECAFLLLGSGLTSRNLPFHQVLVVEPTRWDSRLDGEVDSS